MEGIAEQTVLQGDKRVGLLAGSGRFPVLFAEGAKAKGYEVICVGIEGNADPSLAECVTRFYWNGVARLGSLIKRFKTEGISCIVMAGKIQKKAMFDRWRLLRHLPDWRFARVFLSAQKKDNRDDSLLLALIEEFERDGIHVASALDIVPEILAKAGCMTQRVPSPHERSDISFGWMLAKELGRLDIGQSVVVRERAILALEAIEGTDKAIERAGQLCPSGGFTVVKVAKPRQDMRFDVPTIGRSTIETIARAGGTCLAIETGKTIVIDSHETVELANKHGISVISLTAEQARPVTTVPNDLERRDQRRPA
ncbi:UDP-2,3-diacylglucosamine diphosphatase LpxI [bacterium]|nr:UDP-2,3-diacylglucosamine diphosphatase LpxI [bacterium]